MQIPYLKRSKTAVLIAIFFALTTFPSLVQANNDDVVSFSSKWFSVATVKVASFGSSVFDEVWCVAKSILDVGEPCENVPQPLPGKVTVTTKTPDRFVGLVPDVQIPPSPPESPIDKTRELVTQVMQQEGPTYVTNTYITNPTTIIREVIREFDGGSNGDFVERTLFDAQTTATLDSIQSTASGLQDSITDSVTTAALTVSGNSTLSSLSASGTVTFSLLTGGVLQTDSNGLISTTTIGAAAVTNDSLDFSQLVDNFTLDATATFDLDTNSADMNFDSGTYFIDSSTNRVGIGTTTPSSTLTVAGTTKITGATTLDSTLTVTGNTTLVNASTTNLTVSGTSYFGGQLNLTGSSANIALGSNYLSGDGGDEGVFVSSGGLVGIGTTTPSEALTVVGGISSAGEGTANEVYGLGATLISGPGNGNTLVGAYTEMAAAGFGQYNTIVGAYSSSSNAYNTIIGSRSSATGATSVLIGESLSSSVTYSTVIGANSSVTGTGLLAMGYSAQSSHNNAVAIGWGVASAEDYEYVFGSRAVASTSPSIRLAGSTNQYTGQDLFELDTEWIDSTDATRKSRATLSVYDTAQRTFMQADATGSGVTTSFNGGSVGIGTTTPLSRLAIQTTGTTDILNLFETGGSEVLTVLESGFVGIGASTPAHMVHIKNNSSTYAGLDLEGGQAGDAQWVLFSGYPAAGDFSIRESGVQTSLTIKKTTGNVGIGTTTPAQTLTVVGSARITGSLFDSVASAGTSGMILSSTGSGTSWIATSTLASNYFQQGGNSFGTTAILGTNDTNNLAFETNSSTRMTIDTNGNVGIGTTTPGSLLTVAGTANITGATTLGSTLTVSGNATLTNASTTNLTVSGTSYFGGQLNLTGSSANIALGSNYLSGDGGDEGIYVDGTGNVGIGTTTPAYTLAVQSSGNGSAGTTGILNLAFSAAANTQALQITQNNAGGDGAAASALFKITNAGSNPYFNFDDKFLMTQGGNVGIGTTDPTSKLSFGANIGRFFAVYEGAAGANKYGIGMDGAGTGGNPYRTQLWANGTEYLSITSGGNVGIGTTTPSYPLDIQNASSFIRLSNTTQPSVYNVTMGVAASGPNAFQVNLGSKQLIGSDWTGSTLFLQPTSGNVGIGTTSPATKLSIAPATAYAAPTLGTASGGFSLLGDNALYGLYSGVSSNGNSWFQAMRNDATATAYDILLNPSGGNVGIGTVSPGQKLAVAGVIHGQSVTGSGDVLFVGNDAKIVDVDVANALGVYSQSTPTEGGILLGSSGPTIYGKSGNVGIGDTAPSEKLTIGGGGQTGVQSGVSDGIYANPNADGAQVAVETNSGVEGGILAFDNTSLVYMGSWSNNNLQFRANNVSYMTLTTAGNFGIGTTTPGRILTVAGTVEFRGLTAAVGAGSLCLSSSNEVVYNSGSDNCLSSTRDTKHAITPLTLDAINILNELEPVSFIYNGTDRVRYGFIAENTASVDDILATYNAAGDLTGIDDRSILSVLVRAFQEFYREVMDRFTSQDSRIDALEERIRELEAREGIEAADPDEEEDVDETTADSEVIEGEVEDTDTETQEEPEIPETDPVADEALTAEEPEVAEETEVVAEVENEEEVEEEPSDETLGL